jgi:Tfp pilus assembly protein PilV
MSSARRIAGSEAGISLIEVLIAMVVMSLGIGAIVMGFSSGIVTVGRAAKASTAGAIADKQMETLRGLSFSSLFTAASPMDGTYTGDSAYDATWKITGTCSQAYCATTQTPSSNYRIDTYIKWKCIPGSNLGGTVTAPTCSTTASGVTSRAFKLVTLVVRDAATPTKTLFRESSTFDQATG